MPAATDPRLELVDWNAGREALVFRGTDVPLTAFWEVLQAGRTVHDFLHGHPAVPAWLVLSTLKIAGDMLCEWPDEEALRLPAYRRAVREGDVRFTTGAIRYAPHLRNGRLLCPDGSRYVQVGVFWDNLEGGATLSQLEEWYDIQPAVGVRLIAAAAALFTKGLVPGEDLPR